MASILLVDDQLALEENLIKSLERRGHTVTTAENPQQAMEKFATPGAFDLVITDLGIGRTEPLGGLKVARHIRDTVGDKDTPVILHSYKNQQEEQRLRKEHKGMIDGGYFTFISKLSLPGDYDKLIGQLLTPGRQK